MSFKIQREEEQQQAQSGFHPSSGPSENESWERDTLYKLLMSVHKEQRSSRLWRNIWRGVGAMLFAGTLFTMYSCSSGGGTRTVVWAPFLPNPARVKRQTASCRIFAPQQKPRT